MDYLDPKKEFQHRIMLMVGYICVAVAVSLAAIVLLYRAYGFDVNRQGVIIQNGLTFFSSQPNPADIYVDGKLAKVKTNTRLPLPEGIYQIKLTRDGYIPWERKIQLEGGKVQHYDYPFLIPTKLTSERVASYTTAPGLATQSLDKRWLLVNRPGTLLDFDVYDLKDKTLKPAVAVSLPASLVTDSDPASKWEALEWADNNRHVLLKHLYGNNQFEYILLDRTKPDESINLTAQFAVTAPQVTLKNRKHDQYFMFDPGTGVLTTRSLSDPATPVLSRVLAYKTYGENTILYVTDNGAPTGKVLVRLLFGNTTYTLRSLPAGNIYLADLTTYSGALYAAVSAAGTDRVYIYKDPVGQLRKNPKQALVPQQVLHIEKPNYMSFSSSAQFVMAENAKNFALYDFENKTGYRYAAKETIDPPQTTAAWMDGHRLSYISGGKHIIFDYDYLNRRTLAPSLPSFKPAFASSYEYVYTFAPAANGQVELLQTSLLAPQDR
jgi:hypothetical protein